MKSSSVERDEFSVVAWNLTGIQHSGWGWEDHSTSQKWWTRMFWRVILSLSVMVPRGVAHKQISDFWRWCRFVIVSGSRRVLSLSEILESVLQTVQKQFTYRQYILTDLSRKTMCIIHIHILSTHSVLFKTYLQLSIHVMHRMYTFYIMYIIYITLYIHTIVCEKKLQQILDRPDTQCHGCALHGIQW